jgi:hypothetical protein
VDFATTRQLIHWRFFSKWGNLPVKLAIRAKNLDFYGLVFFWLKTVLYFRFNRIGASYKDKLPFFEIRLKLHIFYTHIDPFVENKIWDPLGKVTFSLFGP